MLKFDKLKLVTKTEFIKIEAEHAFEKIIRNNTTTSLKFNTTSPYLLYIEIDYIENELVIEFSGKILGNAYKKLISAETIRQCFENINLIGVCSLDIERILEDAVVVKCDVTQDVECDDIAGITTYVRSNLSNYNQYTARLLRNGNFVVEKNVTTRQAKKRLTIYDKDREMNRTENRNFMSAYRIPETNFDHVCRFEMNLNSIAQIKASLKIPDTQLMTVLTADGNPIAEFIDDIVAEGDSALLTDKQTYLTELVLRDCHYDLAEVEAKMRQIYAKGTNLSKIMKLYREALANINTSKFTKTALLEMLR